jgi:hypothetical protein
MPEKEGNMKENDTKTLEEGILKDITRVIVETDEENPVPIAVITADNIEPANGYRVRMRPKYQNK